MIRALVLAAALVGSAMVPAHAGDTDGPAYQMPLVGECHQVSYAALSEQSEPSPAVDCATQHTALVIASVQLPADTDWSEGSADLAAAQTAYCLPAFKRAVGRSWRVIARSAFLWSYWIPTEEQRAHGASWLRCDVNRRTYRQLLPVGSTPLLRSDALARNVQRCLQVRPAGHEESSCSGRHNHRVSKVLTVPGSGYRTTSGFLSYATAHCPGARQSRKWFATWRSPVGWNAGDHTLVCYLPAR